MHHDQDVQHVPAREERQRDPVAGSEWEIARVDLDAYLRRTGYTGTLEATADALRALQRAHVAAIAFENLDIVLGRGISLDIGDLQDKLVRRGRGGYCFEHNLLFAAVLERLGFSVTRCVARVRMGSERMRPRSHMMLRVDIGGRAWLADVGFGADGLLEPITFDDAAPPPQDSWWYRLRPLDGGHVLQSRRPEGWFDLYSFTPEPQHLVDYQTYNWYTSTHPRSSFTRGIVVQRAGRHRRVLTRSTLTTTAPDGTVQRHSLGVDEVIAAIADTFGIPLRPDEVTGLRALLVAAPAADGPAR